MNFTQGGGWRYHDGVTGVNVRELGLLDGARKSYHLWESFFLPRTKRFSFSVLAAACSAHGMCVWALFAKTLPLFKSAAVSSAATKEP